MHRGLSPLKDLVALWRWIRALRSLRPDTVNVGTPKAGLLGGLAAKLTGVRKRLYIVRGLRLEGSRGLVGKLLWLMEWVSMNVATDVLFVSRSLADEADRRGLLPAQKSWLIGAGSSNGVDAAAVQAESAAADRDALRSSFDVGSNDFLVGFVGRVGRDKGVEALLEAVASPDPAEKVKVVIIGPIEDPELTAKADRMGDRVRTLGWTSEVWSHLAAIDALCLPTRREGFPNVVLEAAAAGIPTITTRATGAIDSVVDGETGLLVDIDDAPAMTAALNALADDQALVSKLGLAARQRVENEFQPERIWSGIEEIVAGVEPKRSAVRAMNDDST